MTVVHELVLFLLFLLIITLFLFKIYNLKRFYINLATFALIIFGAIESSFLNEPYVIEIYKQKCDEYIKELNIRYPITPSIQIPPQYSQISRTIEEISFLKPTDNNKAAILQNGNKTYDVLFAEMNNAKHHIHIEDFIIRNDETGKKLQEILIKKASQGIKVRLLADAVGFKLNGSSIRKLQKSGVQIVLKSPILQSLFQGDINNRDHRKIYIIDGKTAFTGGVNIGSEYLGKNPKIGYWRDTDIMLTGDAVNQLQGVFLASWYANTGQKIFDSSYYPQFKTGIKETVQIAAGFPVKENPIEYAYLALINSAQRGIFIETPYLNLDESVFKAISCAVLRGVNVVIIIPSKPDEKTAYSLTLQNADKLAGFGVKIYKYPAFIHSKVIIIDGAVASLGTVNLNNRSMHLDMEDTAILYGDSLLDSLNKTFQDDLSRSKLFIPGESKPKGIGNFFYNKLSEIISSTI